MTRRRPKMPPRLTIKPVSQFTAEVRGGGAFEVLVRLGVPMQWLRVTVSGGKPCWAVPVRHVPDVVAMTEHLHGSAVVDGQAALI